MINKLLDKLKKVIVHICERFTCIVKSSCCNVDIHSQPVPNITPYQVAD